MRKLRALQDEIGTLENAVNIDTKRLGETEAHVSTLRKGLDPLFDQLKAKLLEGKESSIDSIQQAFDGRKKEIDQGEALTLALRERIEDNSKKLEAAKSARDTLFNDLSREWLQKEVKAFDQAADSLKRSAKRLLAAFYHLRSCDGVGVYQETIGEAFRYIPGLKIFSISSFDQTIFRADALQVDADDLERVYREISEGR